MKPNKLFKRLLLAAAMMALLPQIISAIEVDGLYYEINSDGISVTVTSGIPIDIQIECQYSPGYSGDITIPPFVTDCNMIYSVTAIDQYAFYQCDSLISVTIPNSVTSIGDRAFYQCRNLSSVTIPNSVTSIGVCAFSGCLGLTSLIIPNSVTSIGGSAFNECNFESIMVESGNTVYDSRENCNALIETASNSLITGCRNTIIPNSVRSIGKFAFARCDLTSVTIPNSVTSIGDWAFFECWMLNSLTIPNSVTSIGDRAFYGCSRLTSLTIPNSVKTIGIQAFYACGGLTSVTIGNSVTSIGEQAFCCSKFETIVVESGNTVYDSRDNCNALIETASNTLITGCKNTVIPNSVTSIGDYAFRDCHGLTSMTIPNSVTSIGDYAFRDCPELTSMTIPNSVISIGKQAFAYCRVLEDIYSFAYNPANVALGNDVLVGVPTSTCILHVPAGSWASYQTASQWNAFTNIVEMDSPTVLATLVSLNETVAEVTEGETLQLTATVLPEDATDKTVSWSTSDATVATVDNDGLVTAVASGTATITASTNDGSNLAATCQVTVSATAPNYLLVENHTVIRGNGLTLPVQLVNAANNLTALQADIHLPDGITIEMDGDNYVIDLVNERVAGDHALSSNLLSNGAVRVLIASPTKKLFTGNDGDLFTIILLTNDAMPAGDYDVTIDNTSDALFF